MSNSPLVTYSRLSPHRTSPRTHAIDTITIHCYVGQVTAKQGCDYFATTTRSASSNYVVGRDGSIGLSVPEADRSWCSSSESNDDRAITIEVACDNSHPYAVTDEAYNALIDLVTDICKRNGIPRLLWQADKSLIGQIDKQNMTVHRWFAAKSCPGEYLYNKHYEIASLVNARLDGDSTYNPYTVWNYFYSRLGNSYGVAGLMGNLQAESGLHSDRVQGDIPYSDYSKEYTAKVDSGEITEYDFVNNGPGGGGYGLAQWTYWNRKQGLYDMWKSGNYTSIGSLSLALDYLWMELTNNYPGVVETLKTATSVRVASDSVLLNFERPADQSESVQLTRESLGLAWYNKYAGSGTGGDPGTYDPISPSRPTWQGSKNKMSFLLLLASTKRNGV